MIGSKVFVLLVVCVAGALCQGPPYDEVCETDKYHPDKLISAPTYVVNLDLPPQQRWQEIGKLYAKPVTELINYIKHFIVEFSPKLQALIDLVEKDLAPMVDTLPAPYADEIKGLSTATGVSLSDMALYNIFYEVFTLCTSIVGQDPQGNMYHGRNLDFGLFLGWDVKNDTWLLSELLRPLIVNVNYTRGGELKYKTVTFVGFVGVITGIRPGHYSFSMNERFEGNGGYIGLFEWFLNINRKQAWVTLLARDVMENEDLDFEKAIKIFAETPLIAPCYYIFGGPQPNQGVVITRDRAKAADIWRLGTNNTWYLAETNYDHWKPPLFLDDRITPCNKCMTKLTQSGFNFNGMFNVLSSKPVLNKLTVYTALMEVKTGRVETYIQYCPTPCWPF